MARAFKRIYFSPKFGIDTAENVSFFTNLFVPLRCLQFLRIVRFTSQPAENEPRKDCQKLATVRIEVRNYIGPTTGRATSPLAWPVPDRCAAGWGWAPEVACSVGQTLQGSFSAVSRPNFASKYAFESSRRDLQNALLCTALKSHFF